MISTYRTLIVSLGAILGIALSVSVVSAWTGPSATAPGSNIAAPVNVGSSLQVKSGDLTTNSHTVYGDLKLSYGWNPSPSTITYLNFSNAQNPTAPTWGLNGYGIRDNNGTLEFKNSGGSWASLQSLVAAGGSQWTTGTGGRIYYNGGNVGIGTASPNGKLQIGNNVATGFLDNYAEYQEILYDSGTAASSYGTGIKSNTVVFNSGGGAYSFDRAGNATTMTLDSSGNVGIGTASPGGRLQVSGGSAIFDNPSGAARWRKTAGVDSVDDLGIWGTNPFYIADWQTGTKGLRINTTSGYLGVNMTPSNALHVSGNIGATGWIGSGCEAACESGGGYAIMYGDGTIVGRNATAGSWAADIRATAGGYGAYIQNSSSYYAELAYSSYGLYTNGNIYGAAFYYTSDRRLKDNIRPLDQGLVDLMKLKPVSFTWNSKAEAIKVGKGDIGLIAQDVEKIFPEAVNTDEATGYKMIDYPKLVPVLIRSIQEQEAKISSLEARLSALEAKLAQ